MKTIKCLIVDDEPIARDILKTYIGRLPELHLVCDCKNATEAYEALRQHPVDLLFLDIQMPVITGTAFLRSLQKPPFIIFTTAYADYAVEGFELNAVDYLLKPITFERFWQAVQKVGPKLDDTAGPFQSGEMPAYIFVRHDTRLVKVNFGELVYIRAKRDFCSLYLSSGKRLLVGMHLKLLEDALPADQFTRVHRSFMINLSKVKAIMGNVVEVGEAEIPISINYREKLFELLKLQR